MILGIRPTDFELGTPATPDLPRLRVKPDVIEDLGSESHLIFTIDAPRVSAEAVRAASDAGDEDEGKLFADDQRAVFTAVLNDRRPIPTDAEVELAVHHSRLHLFNPGTGLAVDGAAQPTVLRGNTRAGLAYGKLGAVGRTTTAGTQGVTASSSCSVRP